VRYVSAAAIQGGEENLLCRNRVAGKTSIFSESAAALEQEKAGDPGDRRRNTK
jgi:hypothetical protein